MNHVAIEKITCPICGSNNITYAPPRTVTCHSCGATSSVDISSLVDLLSGTMTYSTANERASSLPVAGTELPETLIGAETEELVRYQRVRRGILTHTHDEFQKLERDIDELKNSMSQLDKKVEELRGIFPRVVVVEEVPKEEAKRRIEEYFKEHETADIEELMLNLKIPVQTIVEIIDELKQEGKITAWRDEEET